MVKLRGLGIVAACALLVGCGGGEEPAVDVARSVTDQTGAEHAAQACAAVAPQTAVDDIGAEEMRQLETDYGEAADIAVRAVVREPDNTDYADLSSSLRMSWAGWKDLAELVETHGEDTTTWDEETSRLFDRQVTLLLEYEAESDALCERLG
jgi:hypothetical protein